MPGQLFGAVENRDESSASEMRRLSRHMPRKDKNVWPGTEMGTKPNPFFDLGYEKTPAARTGKRTCHRCQAKTISIGLNGGAGLHTGLPGERPPIGHHGIKVNCQRCLHHHAPLAALSLASQAPVLR